MKIFFNVYVLSSFLVFVIHDAARFYLIIVTAGAAGTESKTQGQFATDLPSFLFFSLRNVVHVDVATASPRGRP